MRRTLMILLAVLLSALSSQARRLSVFFPEPDKANGAAVIVCPGGSYYWLSRRTEGTEVAQKLAEAGFTAFVLHYRRAGTRYFMFGDLAFPQNHYPDALNDLQNAVVEVRKNASEYSVDPSKVGVMGFSAGGHLVLNSGEEAIENQGISSRPSFIVSLYPVVTMTDETIVHNRSRKALLGKHRNNPDLRRHLSMELNIPSDMPPVFLVNCLDDPTVDYRNSVVMDNALTKSGIPHQYIQLPIGGHGFGVSSPQADWFPLFLDWFESLPVPSCPYEASISASQQMLRWRMSCQTYNSRDPDSLNLH